MKYLPTNTLAYFSSLPQCNRVNVSDIPAPVWGKSTLEYRKTCGLSTPQDDAITFYALNHAVAVIKSSFTQNEPLPEWAQSLMNTYTHTLASQGKRMLHYILSITTREMRHVNMSSDSFWKGVEKASNKKMSDFIQVIKDLNEHGAVDYYMKHAADTPIGVYMKAMSHVFHHGKWGGSFGGHPWGNVADTAVSMLYGDTSMEMMVDTGYTLAHNTGPIFNKGMMYNSYDQSLATILDVQASGQIPDLVVDSKVSSLYNVKPALQLIADMKTFQEYHPQAFKGYVDWLAVKDKSESGKYKTWQNLQAKKSPDVSVVSPSVPFIPVEKKAVVKPVTLVSISGKDAKMTGTFAVFPGQSVEVYERVSQ